MFKPENWKYKIFRFDLLSDTPKDGSSLWGKENYYI